ncbi:LAFE_0E11254g1_1 [Lachancea fermentati]|uniref:Conserved oligomeric Golgi complex subunit 6 n=1 Tax=Lachancea fermentati TaxID=4955 RepID=A0A1G4ME05_LACFM|nr:LAFE_0E11254g1_1 [Lachancea fermentati]
MDFLDYQTYAVDDEPNNETNLPAPASRLSLKTLHSSSTITDDFQLPDLKESDTDANQAANLHERMSLYAAASLKSLQLTSTLVDADSETATISSSAVKKPYSDSFQQVLKSANRNTDTTDILLSKRLSKVMNDYNRNNFQVDMELRKSFKILQDNQELLHLENQKLVRPDFVGSLARKSLRSDLENELLKSHLTILEDMQPIVRRIKRLSKPVENVRTVSKELLDKPSLESYIPVKTLDQITELRKQMNILKTKKQVLTYIRDKFTLTQVEDNALKNAEVDDFFYEVVNKIMRIKESATFLLALPNPQAGTTLLNQVNDYLEIASKRIYNYAVDFLYDLQSMSKAFGERAFESNDKQLIMFQKSLVYLSNDLQYFNEFLKKVVSIRSQRNLDDFLSQFDVDNTKNSRPIILSAHDPVRYLGDVLAYVHSLIVNEAEFVKSMFTFKNLDLQDTPSTVLQENSEFLDGLDIRILNEIFGPLENSIRIRLEQIIRFEDNPLLNFDIAELLKLYHMMFTKYGILEEGSLIKNLEDLISISTAKIVKGFTSYLENVNTSVKVGSDLLPPEWLSEYMSRLCEFLTKYEKNGLREGSDNIVNDNFLTNTLLDPMDNILKKQLQLSFPNAKKDPSMKTSLLIAEINCFDVVKSRLLPFHSTIFADDQTKFAYDKIATQLNSSIKQLIDFENVALLEKTGLSLYSNLLNMIFPVDSIQDELDFDMYLSLVENPLMSLDKISSNVHEKLNDYLSIALTDVQDNLLSQLISPRIADDVSSECFQNLSKFYLAFRQILLHLFPEQNEEVKSILNFSEDDFKTLVGIN